MSQVDFRSPKRQATSSRSNHVIIGWFVVAAAEGVLMRIEVAKEY
jgi:hypothetical protein